VAADERPDDIGDGEGENAADDDASDGVRFRAAAEVGAEPTGDDEGDQHGGEGGPDAPFRRRQQYGEQRKGGADCEGYSGCVGCVPGIGYVVCGDVQFDLEVRGEGVMLGELDRNLLGCLGRESLCLVESGQFGEFFLWLVLKLPLLLGDEGTFGVALAADRDVLAESHGNCAGEQAGDTGNEDDAGIGGRCCNTDDEGCDGHDAVVRAENARA